MEENLQSVSQTGDPVAINAQKIMIFKKAFEEYNNIMGKGEGSSFVQKISVGYNEIMKNVLSQYSNSLDKLSNVNKKYHDTNKVLEERNLEILHLKAKLSELDKKGRITRANTLFSENVSSLDIKGSLIKSECSSTYFGTSKTPINNNVICLDSNNSFLLPLEKSEHNKIISEMNIKVIDDLDALYFGDKVHMRSNSANIKKIPKLNFNVEEANPKPQKELYKIEEGKKQLKDIKAKHNDNPTLKENFFNTKQQLKMPTNDDSVSFLNKLNNFTTKHLQSAAINYNK